MLACIPFSKTVSLNRIRLPAVRCDVGIGNGSVARAERTVDSPLGVRTIPDDKSARTDFRLVEQIFGTHQTNGVALGGRVTRNGQADVARAPNLVSEPDTLVERDRDRDTAAAG